jgi:hypothetical protein
MLILDFSQIVLSSIMMNLKNEAKSSNPDGKGMIKHMFLNSLLSYKKMFKDSEVVIACDDKKYWRREYFPYYKGARKESREKSDLDWEFIFETVDELKADLRNNFPYKVIQVPKCEADDVIACLVRYHQENDLIQDGLFDSEPKPIVIISADGDFVQLQKYKNVKQWSPMQKKLVKSKVSLNEYIIDHVVRGDAGDGVPNILSPDECLVEHARQRPIRATFLNEFIKHGIDACEDEEQKRNFIRNRTLVDFDYIPDTIYNSIVEEYKQYEVKGSKTKMFNFFIKNKMKMLLDSVEQF